MKEIEKRGAKYEMLQKNIQFCFYYIWIVDQDSDVSALTRDVAAGGSRGTGDPPFQKIRFLPAIYLNKFLNKEGS